MPNSFDFSGYTVTPIKPYVEPSPNPVVARFAILKALSGDIPEENREGFARSLVALNLSELGIKSGVNFNPLLLQSGDTQGTYLHVSNTISVVNKYIKDPQHLGLLLNIIGHEAKHKHQHELNKFAKYFSGNFSQRTVGFLKQVPGLIGEENNAKTLYLLNRSEKDSFVYGNTFAEILLTEALRNARSSGNFKNVQYLQEQLTKTTLLKNTELGEIRYRENDFIVNHLPQFYRNCSTSFKQYLSIAKTYNERGSFTSSQQVYLDRIENSEFLDGTDYQKAVQAAASVLAYLPRRELVKDYIDFALSSQDKNVARDAFSFITQYGIPLTQNDISRIFVCSDMFKGSVSHFSLSASALSRIDEQVMVQQLVISQGFEVASQIIANLKTDDAARDIDFTKVDSALSNYTNQPILTYNGQSFAGCSQVLDYVMQNLIREGKVHPDDLYQVKGELSQNLANIVAHFESPTAQNFDFNNALQNFIADPYKQQFEEKTDDVDQTSRALSEEVANKSAEFTASTTEQQTEEEPELTVYFATNENGEKYIDVLADSLNALAKNLRELAEVLSDTEVQRALLKVSDRNSNGERVLDKDRIIKEGAHPESEEDMTAASCEGFDPTKVKLDSVSGEEIASPLKEVNPVLNNANEQGFVTQDAVGQEAVAVSLPEAPAAPEPPVA
ncbi:MAG: hypothetical protein IKI95_03580 [Clostridia bacterium]|nr:hypothetical protein [Clostridia bacterium]